MKALVHNTFFEVQDTRLINVTKCTSSANRIKRVTNKQQISVHVSNPEQSSKHCILHDK